jgi:hypothetical protein
VASAAVANPFPSRVRHLTTCRYDQIALSAQRRRSDGFLFPRRPHRAVIFVSRLSRLHPISQRVHVSLAAQGRLRWEQMPVRNGSELVPLQLRGLQVRGQTIELSRSALIVKK